MAVRHLPQDLHHQVLSQEAQSPAHRQVGGGKLAVATGEHILKLFPGETPYACHLCGRAFTFQQSYHKHMLYHTDEKPYTWYVFAAIKNHHYMAVAFFSLSVIAVLIIFLQLDLRPLLQGTFDTSKPREDPQRRKALCLRVVRKKLSSACVLFSPQVSEFCRSSNRRINGAIGPTRPRAGHNLEYH